MSTLGKDKYGLPIEIVNTGNGYQNDLIATNIKYAADNIRELESLGLTMSDLQFAQEDTTEATNKLTKVIIELDKKNESLQRMILGLTIATAILALVQLITAFTK